MDLRQTRVRKNGKVHTYWSLVCSVPNGGRVRQEVVAQLGKLDARGRARAAALAEHLTGGRCHPSSFEPTHAGHDEVAKIDLKGIALERSRRFGDVFLGLALWRALELDKLFDQVLGQGREEVPWSAIVAIHTILRFCEPSSNGLVAESLYRKTALEDLLGVAPDQVTEQQVYRALDATVPHKETVEKHLRDRLGKLFDVGSDRLLVTWTCVENPAQGNPRAKHGPTRDHRPAGKQLRVALVVARCGVPLAYEVFDEHRADVTTVNDIVTAMEGRLGTGERVWIVDRGMTSEASIRFLREGHRRYLIGASRSDLPRCQAKIAEQRDWTHVREKVGVKLRPTASGDETYFLCRSARRRDAPDVDARLQSAASAADCDLLRTNITNWTHDELWRTYIQLTDAENAFRAREGPRSMHPVWHQGEDRTNAHILVCFLAHAMGKTLQLWQERAGLGNSPRMILDGLREIHSADAVLPTTGGRHLRVRCVVKPEPAPALLLERLGITLPRRLRLDTLIPGRRVEC